MRRDLHGKVVLLGKLLFDNPGCTSPSFFIGSILDKGPEPLLGKDLPLPRDMLLVSDHFVARALIKLYEIATERFSFNGAIGPLQLGKFGFGPDGACVALNLSTKLFALSLGVE